MLSFFVPGRTPDDHYSTAVLPFKRRTFLPLPNGHFQSSSQMLSAFAAKEIYNTTFQDKGGC